MLDVAASLVTPLLLVGWAYGGLALALGGFYSYPWQLPAVAVRAVYCVNRALVLFVARGCKPRFSEWTFAFEIVQSLLQGLMTAYGDRATRRANAPIIRRQSELVGNAAARAAHVRNGTVTESFQLNGLEHLWVRSAGTQRSQDPAHLRVVVLYFHGSGYVLLSPRLYQATASGLQVRLQRALGEKLSKHVQVDVLLANYRKAPEYPYPCAPLDALAMYKYLLYDEKLSPQQIIVSGDSAGAGLAVTTMLRLRDEDPSLLPVAAVLACPYVDREVQGDEKKTPYCLLADHLMKGFHEAYFQGRDDSPAGWGDASPVHCDLRGLPPAYIQTGELDYILSHSKRLLAKAQACGLTTWALEIFPNMPHAFILSPPAVLPSAAKGLDAIAQYAATHFAKSLKSIATQ